MYFFAFYVYVVSKWPIEHYRLKVAFYRASQTQMIINGCKKKHVMVLFFLLIFNKIGAEIHPYDLDMAHRVPSRNTSDGRPKPIICKFTRRIARESVMAARREVNRIVPADIGLRESSSLEHAAIYDHLSPRLQSLLSDAKKIKERFLFSFCWAKNSTIWLRKNETSRPIAIKNSTDLSSLTARLGSSGDVTTP